LHSITWLLEAVALLFIAILQINVLAAAVVPSETEDVFNFFQKQKFVTPVVLFQSLWMFYDG